MLASHQGTSLASAYRTIEAALEAAQQTQVPEPSGICLAVIAMAAYLPIRLMRRDVGTRAPGQV